MRKYRMLSIWGVKDGYIGAIIIVDEIHKAKNGEDLNREKL